MKKFSLLILLCLSYCLTFAQGFEGIVKIHVEGTMVTVDKMYDNNDEVTSKYKQKKEINEAITFQIKGDMSHFIVEEDNTTITFITDKSTGDVIQITEEDGEKTAMKVNFKKIIESKKEEKVKVKNVTKTGKSKNIRGYLCYEYTVESEDGKSIVWATPEITLNMEEQITLPSENGIFTTNLENIDGFIMQMNSEDKDGNKLDWEATVEETMINDSIFEPEVNDEEKKKMDSQEEMMKMIQEYRQKMIEAAGDEAKIKKLTEELTKKMREFQN